ncbi:hypothetical protein AB0N09_07295 [Streptomyces erythrochromogenes]|uniref:hypothetical protein n=1 Tax=Streptomyces erythrochromogenes TaxID=285574 RepID=UPI00342528BB
MPRNTRWLVALAAGAALLGALPGNPAAAAEAPPATANPAPFSTVTIDRNPVTHGETFTVSATGFRPGEEVYVRLIPRGREDPVATVRVLGDDAAFLRTGRRIVTLAVLLARADGSVSGSVTVPERRVRPRIFGEYHLELAGHGSQLWQSTPITVLPSFNFPDGKPEPKGDAEHKDRPQQGNDGHEGEPRQEHREG